jgi:hypothetical protein
MCLTQFTETLMDRNYDQNYDQRRLPISPDPKPPSRFQPHCAWGETSNHSNHRRMEDAEALYCFYFVPLQTNR